MSDDSMPADLADRWIHTSWSLQRRDTALHVALEMYPPPACYAIARQYDQALEDLAARDRFGAPKPPARPRKKAPAGRKKQQQLELWQDD